MLLLLEMFLSCHETSGNSYFVKLKFEDSIYFFKLAILKDVHQLNLKSGDNL